MNDVLKVIKQRRSTRKFKTEQIKDEYLKEILDAGIYAPSPGNQQPWNFTVIQNQELLLELNDATISCETQMFDDYDRYVSDRFDADYVIERHKTVFEEDKKRMWSIGETFVTNPLN